MPRPPRSRAAPTRLAKAANPPKTAPTSQPDATISNTPEMNDNDGETAAAPRRKSLRAGNNAQQQMAMDRAKQRRDAAMERLQNITSTASSSDEEEEEEEVVKDSQPKPVDDDDDDAAERVKATPVRRPRLTDLSGLDLDDSMFDDLNTTVGTVAHASAHRSAETSTLSVSQFRRRPRAGSFLSRDDGPIRPSSRTGNNTPAFGSTLNFGVFKRRAREPSILSTAQKPRPQRPGHEDEMERDDSIDDDENDDNVEEVDKGNFAPEAESTPLRRHSKRGPEEAGRAQTSSSGQSRKRKSTESHERRTRSSPFNPGGAVRESIENEASDNDSLSSPLSSAASLPPDRFSTPVKPSMDPELMAPPLSSGSSQADEIWPPLTSIPKARTRRAASALRQTPGNESTSDISSPPSLTHSPNYAASSSPPPPARAVKPKPKPTAKPLPKLTTAQLTGMLPRRRHRLARDGTISSGEESEAEVDMSGLREGDDELEHLDVRSRRRPTSRAGAGNNIKPRQNNKKPTQVSKKRVSRTYGRLSDKENQEADEDEADDNIGAAADDIMEEDSQMLVERIGEELKTAVRKFQEVDKWELSFEEKERSSSPVDAR
ncbi:hypothetical protein GGS20DRAFT_536093 [Poronia punctata]|nr:hypothetical protein GGS20DRAFT_536093 [Poronia punctata]